MGKYSGDSRLKVILVIPSLRAGGAERVMTFIATHIDKQIFAPILVITGTTADASYQVEGIPLITLNKRRVLFACFDLFKLIREERPQIVMGAIGHINILLAFLSPFFPKTKFIGRETLVASKAPDGNSLKNNMLSIVFRAMPYFLDAVVAQSKDMRDDLVEVYHFPKRKIHVINNPVTSKFQVKNANPRDTLLRFITIGRLTKQKGYRRILENLSLLNFEFSYTIVGKGPMETEIHTLIKTLKLEHRVRHIPFTSDVATYLSNADIYLQGSYVEGFPNALLESCAVGTPVIAYNAPGGINEIISPGENGYIVNNSNEFITAITHLMKHPIQPQTVRETVISRYSEQVILTKYQTLFENLLKK